MSWAPSSQPAFAWSFSALKSFETCPKKYYHENIAKDVPRTQSNIGDWGLRVHKAIETRIKDGTPLPFEMKPYERLVEAVIAAPGTTMAETKMALNRDYQPTAYFAKDVWLRAQGDAAKHVGDEFKLIDWKLGKYNESWRDQGLVMARAVLSYLPEVRTVETTFVWLEVPDVSGWMYTRENIVAPWTEILRRVAHLERARATTSFPATPNGLCARYCPVQSCPYWGRQRS